MKISRKFSFGPRSNLSNNDSGQDTPRASYCRTRFYQ